MKYKILFSVLLMLFCLRAAAQSSYTVKGTIADSVEKTKLHSSSVAVLQAKDSILVKFLFTGTDGGFSFNGLNKGKYILLVSYPEYADYTEQFSLDSAHTTHDFGRINMELKTRLLREVIVKGTASQMKIKGDTTEFNARAFVIQPNAKVEDLLKQLPGITVDKDGKITAQGQTVNKVLVDGEEFFGDDPTLVTKNIRADMVDKIQLFDKKSDQAAFTGVDDGKTEKTINVKLKDGAKKGVFGKAQAGESPNNIYQGQLLFNAFKGKEKFSVYGTLGNNGKVGLGWEDNQKYGTGDQLDFTDNGININTGSSDDLDVFGGNYDGNGSPKAQTGGIHYDTKSADDKQSVNANYKIGNLVIDGTKNILQQNSLPGSISNSSNDQTYHNSMFRNKLSVVYQTKLDSMSNLKFSVDGTTKHIVTDDDYTSADSVNNVLVNRSTRQLSNIVDQRAFNGNMFYTKKFHKKGRTMSFLLSEAYSQNKANGFLMSHINYYQTTPPVDSVINEQKTNNLQSNIFNTNLTYTEPLTKSFSLVLNYGIGANSASADRGTFNQSAPGVYNQLVDTLSSNYKFNQLLNHGGAVLNYKKGKLGFNFGTRVTDDRFKQINEVSNTTTNRSFTDWAPQGMIEYRFSAQKDMSFSYNGSTTQPTLEQLQPVASNADPLNIIVGNPGLNPSFTNNIQFHFRTFKVITSQFIGFFGNYNFVTNPIVNHTTYDLKTGKSVSQYFNLPGKQNISFNGGTDFDRKFESLGGLNAGISFRVNGNTYNSFINDSLNTTKNIVLNPNLNLSMYRQKKIELGLFGGPTYTISKTSLQPDVNNNGWGARVNVDATIYLPLKFQIGTYSNYQYSAPTQSFHSSFNQAIINAFIKKTFLKNDNLSLEIWGNDLFNQNTGFTRVAQNNLITQTTASTLKRYFMFTINYDFTKMAVGASK